MKRLANLLLLLIVPLSVWALVAEERPGIRYTNQVLFLEKKIMEGDQVAWVTLAYSDPATGRDCQNFIDVLGGRQLFADIPEKSWMLVDFQLRSLVVEAGFAGDADVTAVAACEDYRSCVEKRQKRAAEGPGEEAPARTGVEGKAAGQGGTSLTAVEDRLMAGRQLVKAARCRSCHAIEGFGADHAPSLTWRRAKYEPDWLGNYLSAPYRMRPAMKNLMMLDYTSPNAVPHLQPEEVKVIADYLQQLSWLKSPAGRFRLEPWQSYNCYECHARVYRQDPLAYVPTPVPQSWRDELTSSPTLKSCTACHTFGDAGPAVKAVQAFPLAPDLLLTAEKLRTDYFLAYVRDPDYVQPGSSMPKLALSEQQVEELERLVERLRQAIRAGEVEPVHRYYRMEKKEGQQHGRSQ
ncbi:MAG: cytochrome c [Syntrophotaleaceae bacterium]